MLTRHERMLNLKDDYDLTDYEAYSLAVQIERNEILRSAFVVSDSDLYPSALEKIAMLIQEGA